MKRKTPGWYQGCVRDGFAGPLVDAVRAVIRGGGDGRHGRDDRYRSWRIQPISRRRNSGAAPAGCMARIRHMLRIPHERLASILSADLVASGHAHVTADVG